MPATWVPQLRGLGALHVGLQVGEALELLLRFGKAARLGGIERVQVAGGFAGGDVVNEHGRLTGSIFRHAISKNGEVHAAIFHEMTNAWGAWAG